MQVEFSPAFLRDLKHIKDAALLQMVKQAIIDLEQARDLHDLPGLKRLHSEGPYYRLRVGDYRLGILAKGSALILVRCMHRKDIYRYFP